MPELDNALHSNSENVAPGSLVLFETPSELFKKGDSIAIGQYRTVFFNKDVPLCDVVGVVREVVLGEHVINTMTSSIREPIKIQDMDRSKWSQRKGVPSPEYDILLSLLVPEPELNLVAWDIENAIQQILQPFLDDLSELYSFTGNDENMYF